jgi:hypothetical protein
MAEIGVLGLQIVRKGATLPGPSTWRAPCGRGLQDQYSTVGVKAQLANAARGVTASSQAARRLRPHSTRSRARRQAILITCSACQPGQLLRVVGQPHLMKWGSSRIASDG